MGGLTRRWLVGAVGALVAAVAGYAWVNRCPHLESVRRSVVLITGTSSGIGAELAVQYGRLGARLVVAARRASLQFSLAYLKRPRCWLPAAPRS